MQTVWADGSQVGAARWVLAGKGLHPRGLTAGLSGAAVLPALRCSCAWAGSGDTEPPDGRAARWPAGPPWGLAHCCPWGLAGIVPDRASEVNVQEKQWE